MGNLLLNIGAAYIRVSDERQDEYSPDSQLKKIREYAAREGYQIPDEYIYYDDGISGRTVRKRGDFKRMIDDAISKQHPFSAIYVWKFSRFARNMEDSIIYKSMLRKKGVTVVSVSEPIPKDNFGPLLEHLIEWMDQHYSENLGEEVRRGLKEKIERGEHICAPPYGYITMNKKYYPDEESGAADVVREIFTRFAAGEGLRTIASDLGVRGVRTKFGNPPDNRWVEYALHNPCYIGKIRWSKNGTQAVHFRKYDDENIVTVDSDHEPIISLELWQAVQRRLDERKKKYKKYEKSEIPAEYMLRGLVRCSSCGGTLTLGVKYGKAGNASLQCHNYARGQCHTSHAIVMYKIEASFKEGLREAIEKCAFTLLPKEKAKDTNEPDYARLIALEERKLARAKEAYLAEIDTIEQYKANKVEIEAKIAEIEAERAYNHATTFDPETFSKKALQVLNFIERDDVTPTAKNEALRTIIDKIVFEKANGNLAIYFCDI